MRFELPGIREAFDMFPENIVKRAARSTVNKVGGSTKTTAKEEIRKRWNVPAGELENRITYSAARMDSLEVVVSFGGKSLSLTYFGAREVRGMRVRSVKKKAIVTKSARRMAAAGPLPMGVIEEARKGKSVLLSKAFMQRMKSGHIGVFVRIKGQKTKGGKKDAIMERNVISIASMLNQPEVYGAVVSRTEDRLHVVFPHELEFYLGEAGL